MIIDNRGCSAADIILPSNCNRPAPKRAIAFIDYEYWYYSSKKLCNITPDITGWYQDVSEKYNLIDTVIFGAFGQEDLKTETKRLRQISNHIVMTDSDTINHRKDITDFTILDFMYQSAVDRAYDPDLTYILFTGDGHFQQVVRYLTGKCRRNVVLYGIADAISVSLSETATESVVFRYNPEFTRNVCYRYIIENFESLAKGGIYRDVIPTFTSTVEVISMRSNICSDVIRKSLQELVDSGLIAREIRHFDDGNATTMLVVPNMENLIKLKNPAALRGSRIEISNM